ncbi:MAG TPA: hypothetical protein VKQ06_11300 [Gammaproteobacteria bacterium]|nr:hypothetical protein [Gammaproteobacteria bacterium]
MNDPNIPLLTDVVEESDASETSDEPNVNLADFAEPIDITFDDSQFRIDEDIIVFEADGSRRMDRGTRYTPTSGAPDEARRQGGVGEAEPKERSHDEPAWRIGAHDMEAIVAELQTRIASHTYELTDELMRAAFADFEAKVFRHISTRLREQLPELIDSVIREQLLERSKNSGEGD